MRTGASGLGAAYMLVSMERHRKWLGTDGADRASWAWQPGFGIRGIEHG